METRRLSNWMFIAINGLVFAIFGLLVVMMNKASIEALLRYIGIFALILGGLLMVVGVNNVRRDRPSAFLLIEAIAGLAVGLALLFYPQASVSLFVMLMGIWVIIIGIIQLVILMNLDKPVAGKNLLLFNGLLTIGLGIVLLFDPFQWAVFLIRAIGVLAMVFGTVLIWFGILLRRGRQEEPQKLSEDH